MKNISLIGLGALGVMYAHHISKAIPFENLRIIADGDRIRRYEADGIYCNDEKCHFNYVTPETLCEPADLLIVSVKYTQLSSAIEAIKHHVGKDTIILSVLNGVVSEDEIGEVYGHEHNLYCVSQGMDAVKEGNKMFFKHMGIICFGEGNELKNTEKVTKVKTFFDSIAMPYEINNQMNIKLWSKLMANVGVNQTVALYEDTTRVVQQEGAAREMMIKAMKEVLTLANLENIGLKQTDIDYWLKIIDGLNPLGMPSMRQDLKARRYSELDLFAGTIVKLARKHGVEVPVNEKFYKEITEIEKGY